MKLTEFKSNTPVKNSLYFLELAALLHDIGKLSAKFLDYRMQWQDLPNGFEEDPHEHEWFDKHENPGWPSQFADVFEIFGSNDFSIKKAVHAHINPGDDLALKFIKAADGIDSAQDRNNPLWGAEQKDKIFKSNVFGFEGGSDLDVNEQDNIRGKLYTDIMKYLPDYLEHFRAAQRKGILDAIKEAFEQGLSDTTRPQNDTTLWEHCYSVATITKAIAAHYLLNDKKEPMDDFAKVRFGILGIGWDGVSFLSAGEKIGDILGRKKLIDNVKVCLKELIEYDYCLGNSIYEDDDGIYFLIPSNIAAEDVDALKAEIGSQAALITGGELQPHIHYSQETKSLTHIVKTIGHVKAASAFRFEGTGSHITFNEGKTLCPICRLRPAKTKDTKVCKECADRREKFDHESGETPFIQEIRDKKTKRAALIVARFGLDEWLNGRMIRTLFVTEANGIKNEIKNLAVTVEQFKTEEADHKDFFNDHETEYGAFNYARIKADIDCLFNGTDDDRATNIQFLYSRRIVWDDQNKGWRLSVDNAAKRRNWQDALAQAASEIPGIDIYNMLCAKTPTPSTVLDVWETTREFLKTLPDQVIKEHLGKQKRLRLKIAPAQYLPGALKAESRGKKFDLIFIKTDNNKSEHIEIIGDGASGIDWIGANKIIITDKEHEETPLTVLDSEPGTEYLPFRTITASPNLFMAIVPSDKAVEITREIYRKYTCQFGKVMGRLPFSVGNIFFKERMPMFIVLDAARRMLSNFDRLHSCDLKFNVVETNCNSDTAAVTFEAPHGMPLKWNLPYKLGNNECDCHHPYFIIPKQEQLADIRSTYFEVPTGAAVHFSQIMPGDALSIYPNYYDFEFLDSNARRHDIHLDSNNTRRSSVADFKSRPYLIEELDQHISFIWDVLLKGKGLNNITDAKLRNLQSLWLTKYQEWVEPARANLNLWKEFIAASIAKEFPKSEYAPFLSGTVESGLFFDTLEIYMGILKDRIEKKEEEDGDA